MKSTRTTQPFTFAPAPSVPKVPDRTMRIIVTLAIVLTLALTTACVVKGYGHRVGVEMQG